MLSTSSSRRTTIRALAAGVACASILALAGLADAQFTGTGTGSDIYPGINCNFQDSEGGTGSESDWDVGVLERGYGFQNQGGRARRAYCPFENFTNSDLSGRNIEDWEEVWVYAYSEYSLGGLRAMVCFYDPTSSLVLPNVDCTPSVGAVPGVGQRTMMIDVATTVQSTPIPLDSYPVLFVTVPPGTTYGSSIRAYEVWMTAP